MAIKTKPRAANGLVEFVGPPHRLICAGDFPGTDSAELVAKGALAKFVAKDRRALRIRNSARFGTTSMKLRLARNTPPGSYKAQIISAETIWDAVIDVRPHMQVSIVPAELSFRATPGKRATFVTTLRNLSNIDIEVPKFALIGIFDDDGIETAFAATYGKKFDDANAFLSSFTGKLSEAHGGLMKLRVLRGAGKHPPGAVAVLEIAADIPAGARKGHRYHGVWTTDFGNLAVSVSVNKKEAA